MRARQSDVIVSLLPNSPQHPTAARFASERRVSGISRYADGI
jgi:hypothetical protein